MESPFPKPHPDLGGDIYLRPHTQHRVHVHRPPHFGGLAGDAHGCDCLYSRFHLANAGRTTAVGAPYGLYRTLHSVHGSPMLNACAFFAAAVLFFTRSTLLARVLTVGVCLSVRPSVTSRLCIRTTVHIELVLTCRFPSSILYVLRNVEVISKYRDTSPCNVVQNFGLLCDKTWVGARPIAA